MPDFEMINDDLKILMAESDERRQYLIGFRDGKTHARKEVAVVVAVFSLLFGIVYIAASG